MTQRVIAVATLSLLLAASCAQAATTGASTQFDIASLATGLVRVLLLTGLIFASIAAFKIPGTGVPEAVAVICLAALLVPAAVAGTAQWYEVLAIVAGVALIAVEVFVLPGLGATGVVGAVLAVGGLTMVLVPDPRVAGVLDLPQLRNAIATLIAGAAGGVFAILAFGRYLPAAPGANRLVLRETNAPREPATDRPVPGETGVSLTDLKPGGVVRMNCAHADVVRDLDVVCDRGYLAAGSPIVVVDNIGPTIVVRPIRSGAQQVNA